MRRLTFIGLILSIVLQTILIYTRMVEPSIRQIASAREGGPLLRGAQLAFGEQFAGYIAFVRETTPESGIIALPPDADEPVLGHTGLMQYFMFPRRTSNCPRHMLPIECTSMFAGESVYVLRVGDFPGVELAEELDKRYLRYSSDWGIYMPDPLGEGP